MKDVNVDKVLAIVTAIVIGYFAGWALPEYLVGLTVGSLLVWIFTSHWDERLARIEVDPYWLRRWIVGAHRFHGGDSSRWTVDYCTEPECEEGAAILGGLPK